MLQVMETLYEINSRSQNVESSPISMMRRNRHCPPPALAVSLLGAANKASQRKTWQKPAEQTSPGGEAKGSVMVAPGQQISEPMNKLAAEILHEIQIDSGFKPHFQARKAAARCMPG